MQFHGNRLMMHFHQKAQMSDFVIVDQWRLIPLIIDISVDCPSIIWNKALPSEQTHKVTRKSCKIVIENNCIAWLCWCSALPCPALPSPTLLHSALSSLPSFYPTFPTIPFNLPPLPSNVPYHTSPLPYRALPSPLPYAALLHSTTPSPPYWVHSTKYAWALAPPFSGRVLG